MKPLLQVEELSVRFLGMDQPVVQGVSFDVRPAEVFALVGPSGCGKTTTLRAIAGFERNCGGEVRLGDRVLQNATRFVGPEKRGIGLVFQDYALFPHLSALGNVMFGIRHLPRRHRRQAAVEALWMVGLMDFEKRMPHDLSGGQQQRVALARAVAAGPSVILLDEPFSNLDPDLRYATCNEIQQLAHRGGLALVLVTHDQQEALSTADRLAVMNEGRIIQTGEPQAVYDEPETAFVAHFLGHTNLINVESHGRFGTCELGSLELNQPAQGRVCVSLRPEQISMQPAPSAGSIPVGTVTARQFKGHDITFRVRLAHREFVVQTEYEAAFGVGDQVCLVPRQAAMVVDRQG